MPPPLKLCLCTTHGCLQKFEENGQGYHLPRCTWNIHQADDQRAKFTEEFASLHLGENGLQQALETEDRTIRSQETEIVAALAAGQVYPPLEPTRSTPSGRTPKVLEEMDKQLHGLVQKVESLTHSLPSLSPEYNVDGCGVVNDLNAIEARFHTESDKLRLVQAGCGGDERLLGIHRELENRVQESLQKLGKIKVYWSEVLKRELGKGAPSGRRYDTSEHAVKLLFQVMDLPVLLSGHHFVDSLQKCKPLVQISILMAVTCSVILNLPRRGCSWLFQITQFIIQTTVLKAISLVNNLIASTLGIQSFLPNIESLPYFQSILSDFPRDIRTSTDQFNLDSQKTIYATCSQCHEIYAPTIHNGIPVYPKTCQRKTYGHPACNRALVCQKQIEGRTIYVPIKPYISYDFKDWLAGVLSRQGFETMMDSAWDRMKNELPDGLLNDIFQGSVIQNFKGPDGTTHFSMSGGKDAGRYLFAVSVDWFNPLGNKQAGKKVSIGAITVSCLNLPIEVRNKPENMFLAGIISGEPSKSQINPYLRPLVDDFLELWNGTFFTRTASYDVGRLVLAALVAVVCDLPAARKVGGFSSHSHRYFCSMCWCTRFNHTYDDINVKSWIRRTNEECRQLAERWRSAPSNAAAQRSFDTSGIRWSELLRLPYYEPARFLIIDPMHNLFLGLIKEHFQGVLGYNPSNRLHGHQTLLESLRVEISDSPQNPIPAAPQEQTSVRKIIRWMETPIEFDQNDHIALKQTVKRWSNAHLASLIYVAKGIGCIPMTVDAQGKDASLPLPTKPLTKMHVAERLLDWVRHQISNPADTYFLFSALEAK